MSSSFRKIIVPLVLASFLMAVFFGFAAMGHNPNTMQGDCPFSAMGTSSCPQDTLAMTLHHLSAYQSFLIISAMPDLTALISALLIAAILLILVVHTPILRGPPLRGRIIFCALPVSARTRKMTRWLSLLENSPSLT